MAQSIYITAMEQASGKSVVALGLMETLSARVGRLGYFRPIVASAMQRDPQLELIRTRFGLESPYEELYGLSDEESQSALASGVFDQVEKRLLGTFRELAAKSDMVVCEGTDFAGKAAALEFDLNAGVANQLGCAVLAVVRGGAPGDSVKAVRVARESLEQKGCELFGVIVNRTPPEHLDAVRTGLAEYDTGAPVWVLPELEELGRSTVADVRDALDAAVDHDAGGTLHREVRAVRIAAMSAEHFVADLEPETLVLVPGDRADILLACLASAGSPDVPAVAGVVLTAGHEPGPAVRRLLASAPFPVLSTPARTYDVAGLVRGAQARLSRGDERKLATAASLFQAHVDPAELERHLQVERPARMTPIMFEYELIERAKSDPQRIVLPEGEDDRVLRAAEIVLRRGVCDLTILGDPDDIHTRASALGLDISGAELVDPQTSPLREKFAEGYFELRKHRGMTEELAFETVADANYFATLMVRNDEVAGMVSGAAHTTADTIRPAFEIVKARKGVSVVSSVFLMCLADRVLVYGDCAVNPKPSATQLADIAISSAETAAEFGVVPRIAMLSYSTGESGRGPDVDAVRNATELVRERRPDLKVEGPIQYDAAIEPEVAAKKMPESEVAGRATTFIFPDLETGNIAYKAVQRSAGAVAIGPVLQGLNKPVNDLSRGCTVTDIVNTVVITAIQAQEALGRSTSRLRGPLPALKVE